MISGFHWFLTSAAIATHRLVPLNQWGLQSDSTLILPFHFHLLSGKILGNVSHRLLHGSPVVSSYKKGRINI